MFIELGISNSSVKVSRHPFKTGCSPVSYICFSLLPIIQCKSGGHDFLKIIAESDDRLHSLIIYRWHKV